MSPSIRTMGFFMSDINFCNTKEQLNHLGEVVTGKVDGSPTGADIDTSTLPYTGQVRKTLPALEVEYETSITNKEAEADAAIDEYRLLNKGQYVAGITLDSKFEYITYNGESYFATNPPYTTTATTPDADGNLFAGGYTTLETVANKIGNPNLLSNSNFLTPSPGAITRPSGTPTTYAAGTQIFSGVYAGSSDATVTLINGRVNCSAGSYEYRRTNTNGLDRVPVLTSSVSDYEGNPITTGVSHSIVGNEYVVTVTPAAGDVFSVKLEQGGIATKHEVNDTDLRITSSAITTLLSGDALDFHGFNSAGDGGGSRWFKTGVSIPSAASSIDYSKATLYDAVGVEYKLDFSDELNVNSLGIFADTPIDGALVTDHTSAWLDIVDVLRPPKIRMPKRDGHSYRMQLFKVKADSEVYGDSNSLERGTVVELFYTGSQSVAMCQINSNSTTRNVRVKSIEVNLDGARASLETSSNATLDGVVFTGFRDTLAPINAWGTYLKDCNNVRLIACGYGQNSQSDIAIVDDCKQVELDGCYDIDGGLIDINIEPNSSTNYNCNISLKNMAIGKFTPSENGTGGTATTNAEIHSCSINDFFYDGTKMTMVSCSINGFSNFSEIYLGNLELINTLSIGPNRIKDPYLVNIAATEPQAISNNNSWYLNTSSIVNPAERLQPVTDEKIRATRFNPNGQTGTINLKNKDTIGTAPNSYYVIAVTGRLSSGTSASYLQLDNGGTNQNCRLLRQSNLGNKGFSTEIAIVKALGSYIDIKVGQYVTASDVFDIKCITFHNVIGEGSNFNNIIDAIHSNSGVRYLEFSSLPTMGSPDYDSFQVGDRVIVGKNTYAYSSPQLFELISQI